MNQLELCIILDLGIQIGI